MKGRYRSRKRPLSAVLLPLLAALVVLLILFAFLVAERQQQGHDAFPETTAPPVGWHEPTITFPDLGTFPPPDTSEDPEITLSVQPVSHRDAFTIDGVTLAMTAINQPSLSGGDSEAMASINAILETFCLEFGILNDSDRMEAEEDYRHSQTEQYPFETHERNADYTVTVKGRFVSVLFRMNRRSGGANMLSEYRAFAFDLYTGLPITFADVIGREESFASDYIVTVFSQWIDHNPSYFFSDAKDFLALGDHLSDFYLTEDALILFLNTSIISPMVLGPQCIAVPYDKIGLA